jgi:hypothetical protein
MDLLDSEQVEAELNLRARAVEVLGHFPGEDVGADLRALRIEHPDATPMREQLRAELADSGVVIAGDPVPAARELLASPLPDAPAPPLATTAPIEPPVVMAPVLEQRQALTDDHTALHAEVMALVSARDEHAAVMDQLEQELARFELLRDADLATLPPDDLAQAVHALLDAYRRGDLLAGRLPLVLDGALDGLDDGARQAALAVLAATDDVQAVVITDDPRLVEVTRGLHGVALTWPESAGPPPAERVGPERRAPVVCAEMPEPTEIPTPFDVAPRAEVAARSPVASERCSAHPDASSIVRCAHCGRPSCLDCLVYVIGEPDLWCSTCAVATHGARPRNLRVLRRRGA